MKLPSEWIIATKNKGKALEIEACFRPLGVAVKSLNDYPDFPDIAEDGATFQDNALIKAKAVAARFHRAVLADDSGLCVELLDGEPGVYSARYAGEHATDEMNNRKLLEQLKRKIADRRESGRDTACGVRNNANQIQESPQAGFVPESSRLSRASFVCSLVLYDPATGQTVTAEESCAGIIIDEPRGTGGFGYDPLFWIPEFGRTMAELTLEQKNKISHRGRALQTMLRKLEEAAKIQAE